MGYYDPDADQWTEGIADIESGEWLPVDAVRVERGRDCPTGYPVKGNLPSRVFHSPGQANYDRTTPEGSHALRTGLWDLMLHPGLLPLPPR